jgi:hypothetical protein
MRTWIILAGLALATAATAQDVETDPETGVAVIYAKETRIDIGEATLVDATIVKPQLTPLMDRRMAGFKSMAPFRTNFDVEMKSTAAAVH